MEANDILDDANLSAPSSNLPRALRVATQVFALAAPLFCALFWNYVQKFEARVSGRNVESRVAAHAPTRDAERDDASQDAWRAQLDALYPDAELTTSRAHDVEDDELLDFNAFAIDAEQAVELAAEPPKVNRAPREVDAALPNSELAGRLNFSETTNDAVEDVDAAALVDAAPFDDQTADAASPDSSLLESSNVASNSDATAQTQTTPDVNPAPAVDDESNATANLFSTNITEEDVFGVLEPSAAENVANVDDNTPLQSQLDNQTSDVAATNSATNVEDVIAQNSNFVFATDSNRKSDKNQNPIDAFATAEDALPIAPGQALEFDETVPAPGAASALIQAQQTPSLNALETNLGVNNADASVDPIANSLADLLGAPVAAAPEETPEPTLTGDETSVSDSIATNNDVPFSTVDVEPIVADVAQSVPSEVAQVAAHAETTNAQTETNAELPKIALAAEPGATAPSYFSRAASLFGGADAFSTYYFARTVDIVGDNLLFSPKSFSGAYESVSVDHASHEREAVGDNEPDASSASDPNASADVGAASEPTVGIAQASYANRNLESGYLAREEASPTPSGRAVLSPGGVDEPLSAQISGPDAVAHPTPSGAPLDRESESEYARRLQTELRAEGVVGARVERWDATNWRASGVIASGASGGAEFLQGFGSSARAATEQLRARLAANATEDVRRR